MSQTSLVATEIKVKRTGMKLNAASNARLDQQCVESLEAYVPELEQNVDSVL